MDRGESQLGVRGEEYFLFSLSSRDVSKHYIECRLSSIDCYSSSSLHSQSTYRRTCLSPSHPSPSLLVVLSSSQSAITSSLSSLPYPSTHLRLLFSRLVCIDRFVLALLILLEGSGNSSDSIHGVVSLPCLERTLFFGARERSQALAKSGSSQVCRVTASSSVVDLFPFFFVPPPPLKEFW